MIDEAAIPHHAKQYVSDFDRQIAADVVTLQSLQRFKHVRV
jgi:hypothetical protein